jgi:FG-GAP-like repeat
MHISSVLLAASAAAVFTCAASSQTTFSTKFTALGQYPVSQIQADMNGDGIPDFLAESGCCATTELLSTGPGAYVLHKLSSPESSYIPLATGDFNRDGKNDVFFYDVAGGSKLFWTGYGDGKGGFTSFQQAPNLPGIFTGRRTEIVGQTGDLNGDGRPDLALLYLATDANYNAVAINVHIFLNNGNGFTDEGAVYSYPMPSGSAGGFLYHSRGYLDLLLGDYDADGHADLAVRYLFTPPSGGPSSNLYILYGNGAGKFTPVNVYANRESFMTFNTADVNDDGFSDLASVADDQSVHIFYGHANRTMTETVLPASLNQTTALDTTRPVIADFDGNGLKDILFTAQEPASNTESTGVRGLYQTKPGVWVLGPYTKVDDFNVLRGEVTFTGLFASDYNKDGKPDVSVFVTDTAQTHPDSMALLTNTGSRVYSTCSLPAIGIHVCSPGSTTSSTSVSFNLSATSLYNLRKMEVWVDGVKKSETYHVVATQGFDRVTLAIPAGKHTIGIYAVAMDESMKLHTSFTTTVP